MIRINALITGIGLFSGAFVADIAMAQGRADVVAGKILWSCGASLLPCRTPGAGVVHTLPYWRGSAPTRVIRASYTPAFARTQR